MYFRDQRGVLQLPAGLRSVATLKLHHIPVIFLPAFVWITCWVFLFPFLRFHHWHCLIWRNFTALETFPSRDDKVDHVIAMRSAVGHWGAAEQENKASFAHTHTRAHNKPIRPYKDIHTSHPFVCPSHELLLHLSVHPPAAHRVHTLSHLLDFLHLHAHACAHTPVPFQRPRSSRVCT